jgi:hypothetical protein
VEAALALLLSLLVHTLLLYLFDPLLRVYNRSSLDVQLLSGRVSYVVPQATARQWPAYRHAFGAIVACSLHVQPCILTAQLPFACSESAFVLEPRVLLVGCSLVAGRPSNY